MDCADEHIESGMPSPDHIDRAAGPSPASAIISSPLVTPRSTVAL
jgi:hypothetical protein